MLIICLKLCFRSRFRSKKGEPGRRSDCNPLGVGQWLPLFGHHFVVWSQQSWHDSQPFSNSKHVLSLTTCPKESFICPSKNKKKPCNTLICKALNNLNSTRSGSRTRTGLWPTGFSYQLQLSLLMTKCHDLWSGLSLHPRL